jgi:hypothetical protein
MDEILFSYVFICCLLCFVTNRGFFAFNTTFLNSSIWIGTRIRVWIEQWRSMLPDPTPDTGYSILHHKKYIIYF